MNLSDVKIAVKRMFGDQSGVQLEDTDITRWVNEAQREVVRQNEEVLQKISLADIVANQNLYDLPSDHFVLHTVRYKSSTAINYRKLMGMSLVQFDTYVDGWDTGNNFKGDPQIFCVQADQIAIFPSPIQSSTGGLKLIYSRTPSTIDSNNDELDLPVAYQDAVVNYCLRQAYIMDENPEGAAQIHSLMERDMRTMKQFEGWNPRDRYPSITVLDEDL